ncbi:hypothetical protein ABID21_001282 [Pseudorhizobium tarimense]|uniref:Uncharacterized protein n=1 Tax=Pseudorhizobium tarimense TaxID=1079109 RepID=A0ABV2H3Q2_9HYPH|nr:hypothetical protein [Pseudorhizobium tarimense]MCJ8518403.1 hypothetical protein [Pseudorhizobium tarimense]
MKNAVTLAIAAALSTASLGGISYAQTTASTTATSDMNDMIRIVRVDANADSDDANNPIPQMFRSPTADMTADAQAPVQADPALMAELQENSIELDNVLAIDTAASGGKILYVKQAIDILSRIEGARVMGSFRMGADKGCDFPSVGWNGQMPEGG